MDGSVRALKAAAVAAFAGCSIYDSSLLVDGGADVVNVDSGADVDTCNHAEPPARPAQDDPSDAGAATFVLALDNIDFDLGGDAGDAGGSPAVGLDLDHTCTCPGPKSCVPAANANAQCDDSQGRDNAGGALIKQFSAISSSELNANKVNTNMAKGVNSMVLVLSNYNETPNDATVSLGVLVSNGTVPLDDAGTNPIPKHDGTDQWGIDPSSLIGSAPPYVAVNEDDAAFVVNGVLVAHVSFPFGLGPSVGANFLRVDGAYLVGALEKSGSGYSLTGYVTGRWDTRNILTGMAGMHDPFNSGQFLCGSDSTYQALKAAICAGADISRDSTRDNTNAPCDALSLAVGFSAEPAQLGGILSGNPRPEPCGPTYSDQCGN